MNVAGFVKRVLSNPPKFGNYHRQNCLNGRSRCYAFLDRHAVADLALVGSITATDDVKRCNRLSFLVSEKLFRLPHTEEVPAAGRREQT